MDQCYQKTRVFIEVIQRVYTKQKNYLAKLPTLGQSPPSSSTRTDYITLNYEEFFQM
jgi:hypothetical protein